MEENVILINGGIALKVNVNVKAIKYFWKDYIWNPTTCSYKTGKCLASVIYDSPITFHEKIDAEAKLYDEETKTNFNEKETCKTQNFCTLLALLLISIALFIAVFIYGYLIKCKTKALFTISHHN